MASIKVKFRPSSTGQQEGTIYYQIIHERKFRQISSNYHVFETEWDDKRSAVLPATSSDRTAFIKSVRDGIRLDVLRLNKIIRSLEEDYQVFAVSDIAEIFSRFSHDCSLFRFMENTINNLKINGKTRTSETYRATLNSFSRFRKGHDIRLDCMSAEVMEAYEAWLRSRGVAPNTISFYARILRAVYNRAIERDITVDRHPFRHVYTGIDKTIKRAIPLCIIRKIKNLNLSSNPVLDYARDMFLLSFFLRGMSFIDMAFLRKEDFTAGHIAYRRRKTGQRLVIGWTKEMQDILDKYPANETEYLLPIIRRKGVNPRNMYLNTAYRINRSLKTIGSMVGLDIPLTLYVARHSWASAARTKGIPLSVISEGMGHDSETTTLIYLASLETSVIDKANSLIIKSI